MLEINFIEKNKAKVIQGLASRQMQQTATLVEQALWINQKRKETQLVHDTASAQANQLSKQIEQLIAAKQTEPIEPLKTQ
ncbi:MAG: hypothetical protein QXO96_08545, partial [Sulfolobales archaeon]